MKLSGFVVNFLLVLALGFICCFGDCFAAQIETFAIGLSTPTGLAINTQTRELYVNCGVNGNFWSIAINDDGSSGGINLITSGFTPKLDITLDAEMNVYGVAHGGKYMYRRKISKSKG